MNNLRYVLIVDGGFDRELNESSNDLEYLIEQGGYYLAEDRDAIIYDRRTDDFIQI